MTNEQEEKVYAHKFAIMQIQIDKLKKHNNDLLRKLRNRVKEAKKLEKYSLYKKEFSVKKECASAYSFKPTKRTSHLLRCKVHFLLFPHLFIVSFFNI